MNTLPRSTGLLAGALLMTALLVTPLVTVHADGGGPFPEPQAPSDSIQPEPPAQKDDDAATNEAGIEEASGDEAATPSPSPSTPSTTPSATPSPATTPNPTTPVATTPVGAADGQPSESEVTESNPTASTGSGWVWLLVAAVLLAIGGAVAVALIRRRPPTSPTDATPSAGTSTPLPADPWAELSAADREAFQRTAREFGWD